MTEKTRDELIDEIEALKAKLAEDKPEPAKVTYTVQPGDSLSKIAGGFYGKENASEWPRIYEANKDVIGGNPDLIHPGQKYVIPPLKDF